MSPSVIVPVPLLIGTSATDLCIALQLVITSRLSFVASSLSFDWITAAKPPSASSPCCLCSSAYLSSLRSFFWLVDTIHRGRFMKLLHIWLVVFLNGTIDEIELKFMNRRNREDLNLFVVILNQEFRKLSTQVHYFSCLKKLVLTLVQMSVGKLFMPKKMVLGQVRRPKLSIKLLSMSNQLQELKTRK